jgi:hypothetical protein
LLGTCQTFVEESWILLFYWSHSGPKTHQCWYSRNRSKENTSWKKKCLCNLGSLQD